MVDVIALDFCQLLVIDRREFNQFMARHPAVRAAVTGIAETRRRPAATTIYEPAANDVVIARPASAE